MHNAAEFHESVKKYCLVRGRAIKDLAGALFMTEGHFNKCLKEYHQPKTNRTWKLEDEQVFIIVKTLVEWKAITSQMEAQKLLAHMDGPSSIPINWKDAPWKYLSPPPPPSDIPLAPLPYQPHRYTLLQTSQLIGRREELALLRDWILQPELEPVRILTLVALGGVGKSALAWTWFQDLAPQSMSPLAGRLWWSFYDNPSFDDFMLCALAYVSKQPKQICQQLSRSEQENLLLSTLEQEPYLLVLDGLERLLVAYTPYALDDHVRDQAFDEQTANSVAGALGFSNSFHDVLPQRHRLRRTADIHVGNFLRTLARVHASRILISSRLYPADLQTETGEPRPGCQALVLGGLTDDDALELWYALKVSGSRERALSLLKTFEQHPLFIQVLAGAVAHDRWAPGNLDRWQQRHPDFNLSTLPLIQVRSHILAIALQDLDTLEHRVLMMIASFRMPVTYQILVSLLVGAHQQEGALVGALEGLEDRGLLGWDRSVNQYSLHPLIRGVVWTSIDTAKRQELHEKRYKLLRELVEPIHPMPYWYKQDLFRSLSYEERERTQEKVAVAIEYFHTLLELQDYQRAGQLITWFLHDIMIHLLRSYQQYTELLESLFFPDSLDQEPRKVVINDYPFFRNLVEDWGPPRPVSLQTRAVSDLANTYTHLGHVREAIGFFSRARDLAYQAGQQEDMVINQFNLSTALYLNGRVYEAENAVRAALEDARWLRFSAAEIYSMINLSLILARRGKKAAASKVVQQALQHEEIGNETVLPTMLAESVLLQHNLVEAERLACSVQEMAQRKAYGRDIVCVMRIQGVIALQTGFPEKACDLLQRVLIQARAINYLSEELEALIGLAEVYRQRGDLSGALELLEDVWGPAERAPYPFCQADANNVLAHIQRDAGNTEAARNAAEAAYRFAWCDGPPFAYHWGLHLARIHLAALGAPKPSLPPFDAKRFE